MTTLEPVRIIAASLHGLDVIDGGRTLRLVGTCRRPGTDGPEPADQTLVLHWLRPDGTRALSAVTEPRLRYEDGADRWTGFVADVPIEQVPIGTTGMEISLATPDGTGEASKVPVGAAPGALASSRPIVASGRRVQLFPSPTEHAEFVSQAYPAALAGLRWKAGLALRTVKDLVRRRPFATIQPLRVLTRPFHRHEIWLVGERADTARDNGYHLFTYLRRERPDVRAYYVLDPSSDRFEELAKLGKVVRHSSWRHRVLMVNATVLANAYSIKHMVPSSWQKQHYMRQLNWRVGAYRVYLKHGVHDKTREIRRRTGGYDLFLTASSRETDAIRYTSGYDQQVVETGLPRYDALIPTPPSRTILFMPTWRRYLAPELFSEADGAGGVIPFEGSTYQRFVHDLLSSERLQALLVEHDHQLEFMPHYNLRAEYVDPSLGGDRVTVLDGGASDIQDVMRRCDLFLTDYSSVHFDLAYLGTPLVYTHFDREEFLAGHAEPSWFDHERDGFGPVTHDVEQTVDEIEQYLVGDHTRAPLYDERARQAFTFHDRDNSRRTVEAIEELVRTKGIS